MKLHLNKIMDRFENLTLQHVKNTFIFKESFCSKDFIEDYNSYTGKAYGMVNTLMQTTFLRPKLKSEMVNNLYFTGQLKVTRPRLPYSLLFDFRKIGCRTYKKTSYPHSS